MNTLSPVKLLSIVIPARDEVGSVPYTVRHLHDKLAGNGIAHEIVVVNDGSTDGTWELLQELKKEIPTLAPVDNTGANGFGRAIICGLNAMKGDAVVIMMADESDSPDHVVGYYHKLNAGYECVFGSRFIRGGEVHDYPTHKLILNRLVNWWIQMVFNIGLNDTTNAFKAYRREVIEGCRPFIAPHFNLTVEIPLKAIVRGYSWTTMPISWQNRRAGVAKLKLKEMGSRYLFIILYVWLEKYFSRGDYRRRIQSIEKEMIAG